MRGSTMRRLPTAVLLGLLPGLVLVPAPAGAGDWLGAETAETHLVWASPDEAYVVGGGAIDADGDGTADLVTASGTVAPGAQCIVPPGSPLPTVNHVKQSVRASAQRLAALDGRTGAELWRVPWTPQTGWTDTVETVTTGDLDGDGRPDVLVLRNSRRNDGSGGTLRTTLHDAATGAVRWSDTRATSDFYSYRHAVPFTLDGQRALLVSQMTLQPPLEIRSSLQVLVLPPGAPPIAVGELPVVDGAIAAPFASGGATGPATVAVLSATVNGPPSPSVVTDIDVYRLGLDASGGLWTTLLWREVGQAGLPALVTRGPDPLLITTADNNSAPGRVRAVDLRTGAGRWDAPVDVGIAGGALLAIDMGSDGADDAIIASPRYGDPLLAGAVARLVSLDAQDGRTRWTTDLALGKFRAFALSSGDIDGNGRSEILASLAPQDGFPGCSQPNDDIGAIAVVEPAVGETWCYLHTDRFPSVVASADVDGKRGEEVLVSTLGGVSWAFRDASPACWGVREHGPG